MSTQTSSSPTIRVAVIGASGYAGFEAIRLLLRHPHVAITGLFGPESELGPITDFFPLLSKQIELNQELFDPAQAAANADLALLCVPHKVAMSYVPALRQAGLRVIDWSADYRLSDAAVYEQWYCPHTDDDSRSNLPAHGSALLSLAAGTTGGITPISGLAPVGCRAGSDWGTIRPCPLTSARHRASDFTQARLFCPVPGTMGNKNP